MPMFSIVCCARTNSGPWDRLKWSENCDTNWLFVFVEHVGLFGASCSEKDWEPLVYVIATFQFDFFLHSTNKEHCSVTFINKGELKNWIQQKMPQGFHAHSDEVFMVPPPFTIQGNFLTNSLTRSTLSYTHTHTHTHTYRERERLSEWERKWVKERERELASCRER